MNERITVPNHLLSDLSGDHYVLRVIGDSMIEEAICDGDYVIILRKEEASEGDMIVACVGNDVTLKRYYPQEDKVLLKSANSNKEDVVVSNGDLIIRGIVVGLMRKF